MVAFAKVYMRPAAASIGIGRFGARAVSGQMATLEIARAPSRWFLPGSERMRGGLARHFASAWLFHRGIHFEAKPAAPP
jgi:hypothetical protein